MAASLSPSNAIICYFFSWSLAVIPYSVLIELASRFPGDYEIENPIRFSRHNHIIAGPGIWPAVD